MSRTRTSTSTVGGGDVSLTRSHNQDSNNGMWYPGSPVWTTTTLKDTVAGQSLYRTMTDEVIADFKRRSRKGEIFNNPMSFESVLTVENEVSINFHSAYICGSYDQSDWSQHYTPWTETIISGTSTPDYVFAGAPAELLTFSDVEDVDVQRLINLAVSEAWARINHSEILVLAALAESKKTVRDLFMLFRKVYRIFRVLARKSDRNWYMRKMKKNKKKEIWELERELEELYMTARYSLRPLYYDICGTLRLLEQKAKKDRYTFRGFAEDSIEADVDEATYVNTWIKSPGADGNIDFVIKRTASMKASARAGVLTQLDDLTIWKRMGVDLIPETIWELVPFSFITGWFCNLGNVILQWTPKFGSHALSSWVTVETVKTQRLEARLNSCSSGSPPVPWRFINPYSEIYNCSVSDAVKEVITIQKYRQVEPQRPFLPTWDVNLDALKLLDLGVILKNLIKVRNSIR